MSATEDVKYQLGQMRRSPGESDEKFAIRLFSMQIEVYSANAGRDLDTENGFYDLSAEDRANWITYAKNHAEKHGYKK